MSLSSMWYPTPRIAAIRGRASGGNGNVVNDLDPGMRGDGLRKPVLPLLNPQFLEDGLRNDNLLGKRGEKVEA